MFELDDKNLTRYLVRNGSKSEQVKVPHGLDKKLAMGIVIDIGPQSVTVSVNRGAWLDLDRWDVAPALLRGKFGFHITGSDKIGLQDFRITPN